MNEQILVSIIIPVYNVERYIRRCVMSVCSQSYSRIECVIVNDATPDNSMCIVREILQDYSGNIQFVVINHQTNKGLSVTRNDGVKAATGKYVFFLDSDDELYSENVIDLFASYIAKYGEADFVLGRCNVIGGEPLSYLREGCYKSDSIIISYLRRNWPVIACSKFIRRDFFCENDLWFLPNLYHEDIAFSMKLAVSSSVMISMDEYVYNYYIRDNSITTKMRLKNYMDYLYSMKMGYVFFEKHQYERLSLELISDYYVQGFFGFLVSAIQNPMLSKQDVILIISSYKDTYRNMHLPIPSCWKYKVEYLFLCLSPGVFYTLIKLFHIGC